MGSVCVCGHICIYPYTYRFGYAAKSRPAFAAWRLSSLRSLLRLRAWTKSCGKPAIVLWGLGIWGFGRFQGFGGGLWGVQKQQAHGPDVSNQFELNSKPSTLNSRTSSFGAPIEHCLTRKEQRPWLLGIHRSPQEKSTPTAP